MTPRPPADRLARLAGVRPVLAFVVTLAAVLAGFFLPGIVGAAVLVPVAVGAAALTATTWPVQPVRTRVVRVLAVALLVGIAVAKVL